MQNIEIGAALVSPGNSIEEPPLTGNIIAKRSIDRQTQENSSITIVNTLLRDFEESKKDTNWD